MLRGLDREILRRPQRTWQVVVTWESVDHFTVPARPNMRFHMATSGHEGVARDALAAFLPCPAHRAKSFRSLRRK